MASKLLAVEMLIFIVYGLLLTAVGFHVATWQYWAFGLLTLTVSFLSYYEGKCENGR